MYYSISWEYIINLLLPPYLRRVTNIKLLMLYTYIVRELSYVLQIYRVEKLEAIRGRGIVAVLERILQNKFSQGIFISHQSEVEPVYLYNKLELEDETYLFNMGEPNPLNQVFLKNTSEIGIDIDADFVVNIPVGLSIDDYEVKAIVNKYKIAGKSYIINKY